MATTTADARSLYPLHIECAATPESETPGVTLWDVSVRGLDLFGGHPNAPLGGARLLIDRGLADDDLDTRLLRHPELAETARVVVDDSGAISTKIQNRFGVFGYPLIVVLDVTVEDASDRGFDLGAHVVHGAVRALAPDALVVLGPGVIGTDKRTTVEYRDDLRARWEAAGFQKIKGNVYGRVGEPRLFGFDA